MKKAYIILGCDTDPDRASFISGVTDEKLSWTGLEQGILRTKEASSTILDSNSKKPVFSWCLRVDDQIRHYYGDYSWVLKTYTSLFEELVESGDELSWHPHFWRLNTEKNMWFQEINDKNWQVNMLQKSFGAYQNVFPDSPLSVRMGWNFHNNLSMQTLKELGIKVDFSGVPGMKVEPSPSKIENSYDWFFAPNQPYAPAMDDFQADVGLTQNQGIIEVPNLVSESLMWGYIAGLVLAKKMKDLQPLFSAIRKPRYWINISARKKYFKPVLDQFCHVLKKSKQDTIIFNNYFHADDMVDNNSGLYSLQDFCINLQDLINSAYTSNIEVHFIQARQAWNLLTVPRNSQQN
ncbi:MAG: hypothetical protein KAR42_01665 [candidate division Zixibacteria bacterium]|nr:hypothetical protein [candidate division Zixibacteria bacterium]